MLPAAARIRRPAEFATTVRQGARAGSRALTVHVAPARGPQAGVRVGFVVAGSVGSAVFRNTVRRRLRHLLRARLTGLTGGVDVVVRAHPASARMSSADLGAELDRALRRALANEPVARP